MRISGRTLDRGRYVAIFAAAVASSGCAYEVAYRPDYVPEQAPSFVADGRLLIVMPQEQREFVYQGAPSSTTGDFTTLTVPIGAIVEEIAKEVFGGCFAYGVEFVDDLAGRDDYVLALQGNMQEFAYAYTKVIEQGFDEQNVEVWITPQLTIAFAVKAHKRSGELVLDKTYDSGIREGESYMVTGRPAERINRTLHATLHALMLQVAADVRPLLIGECRIIDLEART